MTGCVIQASPSAALEQAMPSHLCTVVFLCRGAWFHRVVGVAAGAGFHGRYGADHAVLRCCQHRATFYRRVELPWLVRVRGWEQNTARHAVCHMTSRVLCWMHHLLMNFYACTPAQRTSPVRIMYEFVHLQHALCHTLGQDLANVHFGLNVRA